MSDRARTSAVCTVTQALFRREAQASQCFKVMWLRASGARQIVVFEDFEMHLLIDGHVDQWGVEGEQIHAEAVSPDLRCGCFVERGGRRVRRSARHEWKEQVGRLLISITDLAGFYSDRVAGSVSIVNHQAGSR
jgi:hypothetical protein